MSYARNPICYARGVPVYDEQGAKLAESVTEAARRLGYVPDTLRYHLEPYADGYRLASRPRVAPRDPQPPRLTLHEAAAALCISRRTVYDWLRRGWLADLTPASVAARRAAGPPTAAPGPVPAPRPPCARCGQPTKRPRHTYCSITCANLGRPRGAVANQGRAA